MFNNLPILPEDYVQNLGKGFDVTWSEFTKYMNLYNENVVMDFSDAGFNNVRIRIGEANPDATFINRLKMQVDHCLAHGIYPIIAYQGAYIEDIATTDEEARQHLVTWWRNMAQEFKDYPKALSFNILVEISGTYKLNYTAVNSFYLDVLSAIRETNPDRIVIFPPVKLSDPTYLQYLQIPGNDDPYTMAEWHFYAAGPTTDPTNKKYWNDGSTSVERDNITHPIQTALEWMQNTGYKTWVGAWMAGNYNKGNEFPIPEQVAFATFMARELAKANIPWSINAGNKFYDYETNTWFSNTNDSAGMPVRDVILDTEKIAIYQNTEYAGASYRLASGDYNKSDLEAINFLGQINSLMVPFDFKVELYSKPSFKGSKTVITSTLENCSTIEIKSLKVIALHSY
ncbi:glycoside hydrolase family 5 protein [Aestuariibaculum suncheonense]|uniref:Cellulase family glycosylhydrolase n=1 Tax=Aestuariibaculum suncheonense TaxID=1028745 RepID=A0A8J6UKE9_9FLAO|nr:cellulase family glycosylhydrolase [Aestuariibaculum suncheonense]MBD0835636.1 cellulase family glycosylhydrolase [Aestuariibaculum suncheonense]